MHRLMHRLWLNIKIHLDIFHKSPIVDTYPSGRARGAYRKRPLMTILDTEELSVHKQIKYTHSLLPPPSEMARRIKKKKKKQYELID